MAKEQPKTILTVQEVASAIGVDPDYPQGELLAYAKAATAFICQKTGKTSWPDDDPATELAKTCARWWIQEQHFQKDGYDREHDYSLGISSILYDLQGMAMAEEEEGDE